MGKPVSKRTRPTFTKQIRRKKAGSQELDKKKVSAKRDLPQDKNLKGSKVQSMDSQSNHSEEEKESAFVSSSLTAAEVKTKTEKKQQTKTSLQSDSLQKIESAHQNKSINPSMQAQEIAKVDQTRPAVLQNKSEPKQIKATQLQPNPTIQLKPNPTHFFTLIQSQKTEDKINAMKKVMIGLERENHNDANEIVIDNRFMMELIDIFRKNASTQIRLEILKMISLVFSKFDSSCIKWIQKQTIYFLIQLLDEQKHLFIASAQILEGLALKSVHYRDLIIQRKVIFKLLEPSLNSELVSTKVSTLSSLCCGQPYVKRVFTEPIARYLFRHIKSKSLPKGVLLKALTGIKAFFESIKYNCFILLLQNNIDAIFSIIESEMTSKSLPIEKNQMSEESEQTVSSQKLSPCILAASLLIIKVVTVNESFNSDYTRKLQVLEKNKITQILQALIMHDSYEVRLSVVKMIYGLIDFYSMQEQQKMLENKFLMKRLVELFQSENTEIKSWICDIYTRIVIYVEEQTYVLEFYLEYDIVDLLVNAVKGCQSNELLVNILNTLKIMLEYSDQIRQTPAKYEHFFKESAYCNPLVNILMMVPGVQAILDELYQHDNESVRNVAQQLKMTFIPSPDQDFDFI